MFRLLERALPDLGTVVMRITPSPTGNPLNPRGRASEVTPVPASSRRAAVARIVRGHATSPKTRAGEMENAMKALKHLTLKLVRDEQGGEVLEYALIAGLIVVAAIAIITSVGTKVVAKWTSLNSSI